ELDRVLHRQDVALLVFVDVVDDRRQRGRLARPRRAGDQNNAARLVGDLDEHLRRLQVFQAQHLGGNGPEHGTGATVLDEGIDAEARKVGNGEGKVTFQVFLVELALAVVHDVVD